MSAHRAAVVTVCALAAACGRGGQPSVDTPIAVAPATPATSATPPTPATAAAGVRYDSVVRDRVPGPAGTAASVRVERPATDSIRGIVAVVGSRPMTQLVVRPAGGGSSVRIEGAGSAGLASLSGAEVVVWGRRSEQRVLDAVSFAVRTVDGAAAVDGILERSGDAYALRLTDGSRRMVTRPSPALRERVGSRVWVTGPADVEPQAFGIIEP